MITRFPRTRLSPPSAYICSTLTYPRHRKACIHKKDAHSKSTIIDITVSVRSNGSVVRTWKRLPWIRSTEEIEPLTAGHPEKSSSPISSERNKLWDVKDVIRVDAIMRGNIESVCSSSPSHSIYGLVTLSIHQVSMIICSHRELCTVVVFW